MTKLRQIASRVRSSQQHHEERGKGHMATRPITLPPMPWDNKPTTDANSG